MPVTRIAFSLIVNGVAVPMQIAELDDNWIVFRAEEAKFYEKDVLGEEPRPAEGWKDFDYRGYSCRCFECKPTKEAEPDFGDLVIRDGEVIRACQKHKRKGDIAFDLGGIQVTETLDEVEDRGEGVVRPTTHVQVVELRKAGLSLGKIADRLNVSKPTVWAHVKRHEQGKCNCQDNESVNQ